MEFTSWNGKMKLGMLASQTRSTTRIMLIDNKGNIVSVKTSSRWIGSNVDVDVLGWIDEDDIYFVRYNPEDN